VIRLVALDGMDPQTCPAIVCCGGRMDFHGAPLGRSWVKLGHTAHAGDADLTLAEPVEGWRAGDRVIVTATQRLRRERSTLRAGHGAESMKVFTEERTLRAIDGTKLTLDAPLELDTWARGTTGARSRTSAATSWSSRPTRPRARPHDVPPQLRRLDQLRRVPPPGQGGTEGQVQPALPPGRRHDARKLGDRGVDLGQRQPLDHHPRTNHLVVRDCVGYQSVGHGFYLEDGTEVDNVLDRNLAVQAFLGKPVPEQALPFDNNGGAGFWWANSRNTFTRNAAVECDRYGFKFEATPLDTAELGLNVNPREGTPRRSTSGFRSACPTGPGRSSTSARSRSYASRTTRP